MEHRWYIADLWSGEEGPTPAVSFAQDAPGVRNALPLRGICFICTWEQPRASGLMQMMEEFRRQQGIQDHHWNQHAHIAGKFTTNINPPIHVLSSAEFPVSIEYAGPPNGGARPAIPTDCTVST